MTARRHLGVHYGRLPGSRDNPDHDPPGHKAVEVEARQRQAAVDREARRTNRAYGNLNLSEWSERRTGLKSLQGRPRNRSHDD